MNLIPFIIFLILLTIFFLYKGFEESFYNAVQDDMEKITNKPDTYLIVAIISAFIATVLTCIN